VQHLEGRAIEVEGSMLSAVSAISCNNDKALGSIIAEAYQKVGKDGVVLMEEGDTDETHVELVDGVQFDCGLTSPHFVTNTDKHLAELDNPYVLIVSSEIPNVRKIQSVLEHVIKKGRALLIIAPVAQGVKSALMMNKVKGNIKVNIVDLPGFGPTKKDATEDLAIMTGATVINEELGDDLDLISPDHLGEVEYVVTSDTNTVITLEEMTEEINERIKTVAKKVSDEKNGFMKKKLEERLAMLSGSVGIIKVGAGSKVELKEKKDRVEDAIYATKAALKEGIIPGGGSALWWASQKISPANAGEEILLEAIKAPMVTILDNAGLKDVKCEEEDYCGIDVISGECTDMIKAGVVDPVLVTKSALKNAVSVVSTIISADCVISNARADESNQ
jgi:chaperonin GroEL